MKKLQQLLSQIETFYKAAWSSLRLFKEGQSAGFHMPDDPEENAPKGGGDLFSQSEQFDIKDEELFNQFETFMDAYQDLTSSLAIDAKNITPDVFEEAGQLIDTLKKRYDRLINNPYLNATEQEGYEEDFDPGEFTQFLTSVAQDAENKLKQLAGEDIDISELQAAQYAQEFNDNRNIDRGDPNIRWTGDKVQQNLEARKRWFQDLMFRKKVNINDPRYQNYITTRRSNYQNIIADPERKSAYREKAKKRQAVFYKKLDVRKAELLKLISQTTDPRKMEDLQKELMVVEKGIEKRKEKSKEVAKKIKELKSTDTLASKLVHLQQKLASFKNDTAKALKNKASKDPFFKPYKEAVKLAKETFDAQPSPTNQTALEIAIRKEAEAIKNYLDNHPATNKIKEDFPALYSFRDKIKELDSMGWLDQEILPEELKMHLHPLVGEGERIVLDYGSIYKPPITTIRDIVDFIKGKI